MVDEKHALGRFHDDRVGHQVTWGRRRLDTAKDVRSGSDPGERIRDVRALEVVEWVDGGDKVVDGANRRSHSPIVAGGTDTLFLVAELVEAARMEQAFRAPVPG